MTLTDCLTILAIVLGPIVAVLITRWLDDRRERLARRMDVFRTLMRTRRNNMSPEHVGALNLVEIEFSADDDVMKNWRALLNHFGTVQVRRPDETHPSDAKPDDPEVRQRNERFYTRLTTERQSLLAKLLHAMAKALRFPAEQLEIFEGGYTPQGWVDQETEQMLGRRFLLEVLRGDRAVPVVVYQGGGGDDDEDDES